MPLLLNFLFLIQQSQGANWDHLSGAILQVQHKNGIPNESFMWTPRFGHAVTVINQTSEFRNDLTIDENSKRVEELDPQLILLGGDDYNGNSCFQTTECEKEFHHIGGLKNDVWSSIISSRTSSWWRTELKYNSQLNRMEFDHVESTMVWNQVNPGFEAPEVWPEPHNKAGEPLTYYEWIQCQDYFDNKRSNDIDCKSDTWKQFKQKNMWTPRKGHGLIVTNGSLIVIGGRSNREISSHKLHFEENQETNMKHNGNAFHSQYVNSVLTNDIWISTDGSGKDWKLVTLGCKDHQEDILLKTELWTQHETLGLNRCSNSSECFGDAVCKAVSHSLVKVCVCPMFSMREDHSVSVQHRTFTRPDGTKYSEDYIYIVGGFTYTRNRSCDNHSCGSSASYKQALSDIWVASFHDLTTWVQLKPAMIPNENFKARGGHGSVLAHANYFRKEKFDELWILGGYYISSADYKSEYLNDVWRLRLPSEPCCVLDGTCDITHHSLHSYSDDACLAELKNMSRDDRLVDWSGRSHFVTIYEPPSTNNKYTGTIVIVGGNHNNEIQSDVWSLELDLESKWKRDFYLPDTELEQKEETKIEDPEKVDHRFHFDQFSKLSHLTHMHLPVSKKMQENIFFIPSTKAIFSKNDMKILTKYNLRTFGDLDEAKQRTILSLRGYDYPGVETQTIRSICYAKALIRAFLLKCSASKLVHRNHQQDNIDICDAKTPDDLKKCIVQNWNGCDPIPGYQHIDIHGIGMVDVPSFEYDISSDLENMHCKQTVGDRYLAAGAFIDGKAIVLGGRGSNSTNIYQDVWSRDVTNPIATINMKPKSHSSQSKFTFECSKDGVAQFEYKVFDFVERLDVTPWILAAKDEVVDISWLDTKQGGPGSGWYTMYVRAISPSGNRDESFSLSTNTYTWYYLQPLPYSKIFLSSFLVLILVLALYYEYRRRERKALLENFAKRKMRRQFKLQSMAEGRMLGSENTSHYYPRNRDNHSTSYSIRKWRQRRAKIVDGEFSSDEEQESVPFTRRRRNRHSKSKIG
jgi:hypothetical protein